MGLNLLLLLLCLSLLSYHRSEVPSLLPWYNLPYLHSPERTFLAWLRTSLAFASIGIAVTQLFRLNSTLSKREGYTPTNPDNTYHLRQLGKPLGATFLGIAILVLLVGGRRYFESQVCQRTSLKNRWSYTVLVRILKYKPSIGSCGANSLPAGAASFS